MTKLHFIISNSSYATLSVTISVKALKAQIHIK